MRDRALQETITVEAERRARPAAEIARQAERNVKEVAARMSPLFFEFIRPLVVWICTRLYQGIHLDEEGIAEVRQAANRGGLVLCPSHKSHMDYVILTLLFYEKGLLPPHVAAGINLAFWPFGAIARWCGGFFIRRSFKGDHLYSAVVRAYVKRLMRDGFPQEFFIEGGRSRTGKLAFPKTGLLAMEVDAWREGAGEDLFFVPVAIDYEKLPEGGSYARELGGGEKKKENVWSLLEARKILRTRHGRIYVQFDRPISLAELTGGRDRPLVVGDRQGDAGRRAFVQSLANRIAYGINRASTITPVGLCAAALLSGTEPITGAELAWRLGLLRRIAVEGGGRLPAVLADAELDPAAGGPIGEALAMLRRDGVVEVRGAGETTTYGVPRARRAELDFFRNNVIHHFVAMAIIAAARGARPPADPAGARTLEADTRWLSRLFKLEFMYRVGARFETIFAETRQAMAKLEIDGAAGAGPSRAESFLSQMVVPYADAYRIAALALTTWPGGDRRAFVRSALQKAGEEVAAGRIEPEAASKTTLENATAWLIGEGAFESPGGGDASDGGGRLRVSAAWRESRAPSAGIGHRPLPSAATSGTFVTEAPIRTGDLGAQDPGQPVLESAPQFGSPTVARARKDCRPRQRGYKPLVPSTRFALTLRLAAQSDGKEMHMTSGSGSFTRVLAALAMMTIGAACASSGGTARGLGGQTGQGGSGSGGASAGLGGTTGWGGTTAPGTGGLTGSGGKGIGGSASGTGRIYGGGLGSEQRRRLYRSLVPEAERRLHQRPRQEHADGQWSVGFGSSRHFDQAPHNERWRESRVHHRHSRQLQSDAPYRLIFSWY